MKNAENTVNIDGCAVHLMPPVNLNASLIGCQKVLHQLAAAWLTTHESDVPMSPVVVGKPGCGKTSLIAAMAQELELPLYIFQCTMDTRPEDLVITPVLTEDKTIRYQASSLVSAMLTGGVCILDEGNRMRDKAWASLAPLLDSRRYVESLIIGRQIKARPEFRVASTMNEDASVFKLPEYIASRLRPRIEMPDPDADTVREIIHSNLPFINKDVLKAVLEFYTVCERREQVFSLRQAVQLAAYTNKRYSQADCKPLEHLIEEGARAIADYTSRKKSTHGLV